MAAEDAGGGPGRRPGGRSRPCRRRRGWRGRRGPPSVRRASVRAAPGARRDDGRGGDADVARPRGGWCGRRGPPPPSPVGPSPGQGRARGDPTGGTGDADAVRSRTGRGPTPSAAPFGLGAERSAPASPGAPRLRSARSGPTGWRGDARRALVPPPPPGLPSPRLGPPPPHPAPPRGAGGGGGERIAHDTKACQCHHSNGNTANDNGIGGAKQM